MKDVLEQLMASVPSAIEYADARFVETREEQLSVRNGEPESLEQTHRAGIGVRAQVDGAWGFAATDRVDADGAGIALERAIAVARAQPRVPRCALAPEAPARGEWHNPIEVDPFEISLEEKLSLLVAAERELRAEPLVVVSSADYLATAERRIFASSDGALTDQRIVECGGGVSAVAVSREESQTRSYPGAHQGSVAQAGHEHFLGLGLQEHTPRVASEAVELLSAPLCPAGETTVILDGQQLALQIHESVGHAVELDRILGQEASYAGMSWVGPDDRDALRYGSALMNMTADATSPGGLGTFGWDDEGVPAQRTAIVSGGVLRGYLSSRESAAAIGLERSGGCMRAEGFARQPIVRMTNINLEPGDAGSLADLIADTDTGLLLETNRSWSIDSRRLHFQFATEVAREIRDGEVGRLLRNPSYGGVTPAFWAGLDAVCSAEEWRLWSVLNCGKGEPGQTMRVSHGAAPARFRDVRVGIA